MDQSDLTSLPRIDQAFLGLGLLVFIASFLPWYGYSFNLEFAGVKSSGSDSTNAWHGLAAFGLLLLIAASAIVIVQLFADATLPRMALSWNVVVLVLTLLGTLFVLVRSFDLPSASGPGVDEGLRWGGYLLIIACVAMSVVAFLRFRASGEALPWDRRGDSPVPPPPPAA